MLKFSHHIFWKNWWALCLLTGFCSASLAQNREPSPSPRANQTIFFEALGNGLIYSLNYDYLLSHNGRNGFSFRGGLSLYPVQGTTDFPHFVVPLELNYLAGNEKMFELGIGASILDYGNNFWPSLRIGYRRQKLEGGFFFRVGFLLARIAYEDDDRSNHYTVPSIGLGFGYSFPKK